MDETIWLGLDARAGSITICKLVGQSDKEQSWTIPNEAKDVRRTFTRLKQEGQIRRATRQAPRLPPVPAASGPEGRLPGDRAGADPAKGGRSCEDGSPRRDQTRAALPAGELTTITVPTTSQETARDVVRARESIRRI